MRIVKTVAVIVALAIPLALGACGGGDEHKTVVVNPQPGQTVVVPPSGVTKVCPSGQTTC